MTDNKLCRDDGRCECAIQSGAEGEGHCQDGKCAMPQPAAHLTIPGALEWDGDNGTHGAGGESRAHGESEVVPSGNYVQPVPDHCDRITWRGSYYHLPLQRAEADQLRTQLANTEQSRRSFFDLSQDLEKRLASLKAFAGEMISASFEGGSFDGGDIQDIGVKHGLLRVERRTEECGEVCACREYGFPAECYRKTDLVKGADQ